MEIVNYLCDGFSRIHENPLLHYIGIFQIFILYMTNNKMYQKLVSSEIYKEMIDILISNGGTQAQRQLTSLMWYSSFSKDECISDIFLCNHYEQKYKRDILSSHTVYHKFDNIYKTISVSNLENTKRFLKKNIKKIILSEDNCRNYLATSIFNTIHTIEYNYVETSKNEETFKNEEKLIKYVLDLTTEHKKLNFVLTNVFTRICECSYKNINVFYWSCVNNGVDLTFLDFEAHKVKMIKTIKENNDVDLLIFLIDMIKRQVLKDDKKLETFIVENFQSILETEIQSFKFVVQAYKKTMLEILCVLKAAGRIRFDIHYQDEQYTALAINNNCIYLVNILISLARNGIINLPDIYVCKERIIESIGSLWELFFDLVIASHQLTDYRKINLNDFEHIFIINGKITKALHEKLKSLWKQHIYQEEYLINVNTLEVTVYDSDED